MSYLDLLIEISNGDIVCSIFDKRHAFDFHVVNFPNLFGYIPTAHIHIHLTADKI